MHGLSDSQLIRLYNSMEDRRGTKKKGLWTGRDIGESFLEKMYYFDKSSIIIMSLESRMKTVSKRRTDSNTNRVLLNYESCHFTLKYKTNESYKSLYG